MGLQLAALIVAIVLLLAGGKSSNGLSYLDSALASFGLYTETSTVTLPIRNYCKVCTSNSPDGPNSEHTPICGYEEFSESCEDTCTTDYDCRAEDNLNENDEDVTNGANETLGDEYTYCMMCSATTSGGVRTPVCNQQKFKGKDSCTSECSSSAECGGGDDSGGGGGKSGGGTTPAPTPNPTPPPQDPPKEPDSNNDGIHYECDSKNDKCVVIYSEGDDRCNSDSQCNGTLNPPFMSEHKDNWFGATINAISRTFSGITNTLGRGWSIFIGWFS